MRHRIRNLVSIALILCVVLSLIPARASAAKVLTAKVTIQYAQSEARKVMDIVNGHRSVDLRYDYQLEQAAMQRAAELVVKTDHLRPDGTQCYTAVTYDTGYVYECMCLCTDTAAATANQLLSSTTGHREALLGRNYRYLGVGHVIHEGVHYWIAILSEKPSGKGSVSAKNGSATVSIRLSSAQVSYDLQLDKTRMTLNAGQTTTLPEAELVCKTNSRRQVDLPVEVSWTSSRAAVAKPSGTQVSAVSGGTATLTAKLSDGTSSACAVTVKGSTVSGGSLAAASVTLSARTAIFTGKNITPAVTVKLSGKTLQKDKDYTVSYQNNQKVGTAKVTVTGKGSYSGKAEATFSIQAAQPVLSGVKKSGSAIQVSWKKAAGAVKYRVFVKEGNGSWKAVGDTTGTSLTVKAVDSKHPFRRGVRYTFTVRCVSSNGKQYTSTYNAAGKSITY